MAGRPTQDGNGYAPRAMPATDRSGSHAVSSPGSVLTMSADALTSTTVELFRDDATLRECSAWLVVVDEHGVQLDRTVFYPQGGGQAGDRGELLLADGAVLAIIDTRKGDGAG